MSLADTLRSAHSSGSGTLAVAAQVAALFGDKKVVGSFSKAIMHLSAADQLVRTATGGEHSIFSKAAEALDSARPRFNKIVETTMGGARSEGQATTLGAVQAAATKLMSHLTGKGEGASEITAQSTGIDPNKAKNNGIA